MISRGVSGLLTAVAISIVIFGPAGPAAAGSKTETRTANQIIRSNALLRTIFEIDQQQAVELTAEARRILSTVSQASKTKRSPSLIYRGSPRAHPPSGEGEIISKNRKDFEENPVLQEIYMHSPLASLRMLKRLREATKKN